ncbi:hypothetical protein, partial [Weizmannia acidilactici]|uniref:hypothetical protein n=1 Tax=Weizmannia acidilactici TaxID=2607726 RepID=UPI001C129AD2
RINHSPSRCDSEIHFIITTKHCQQLFCHPLLVNPCLAASFINLSTFDSGVNDFFVKRFFKHFIRLSGFSE